MDSRALLCAAALVAACGSPAKVKTPQAGFQIEVDSTAPFTQEPDFPSRVESTVDAALAYWGGTREDLQGVTITFSDSDSIPCNGSPSLGCYDGNIWVTTRDPSIGTVSCVEETVLVHEIGHAVIGDFLHEDPRWMEMDPISEELADRTGYTAQGLAPCPIYLSVWRHPLGLP